MMSKTTCWRQTFCRVGTALFSLGFVSAAMADLPSTAPLAKVRGEIVTVQDLTSYSEVIGSVEGRIYSNMSEALDDYLLTLVAEDVVTTVTNPLPFHRQFPLKYSELSQRRVLARDLTNDIIARTTVTLTEMREWYDANKESLKQPAEIQAYHIFLQVSDDIPTSSLEAQMERMKSIKAEADGGTSFGLLAQRFSEADSAADFGAIGRLRQGQPSGPQNRPINPVLDNALFALQEGQVSEIVQTSHGLHLLFARQRQEAVIPSLEELERRGMAGRDLLRNKLEAEQQRILSLARENLGARILTTDTEAIVSGAPIYEIRGERITLAQLEQLYDTMFTRQWHRIKDSPVQVERFIELVLDDLLVAEAAVMLGMDQYEGRQFILNLIAQRAAALRKNTAVAAEIYPVTDEQLKQLYEDSADALRRPEADGEIVVFSMKPYPDTPSQVRAAREARRIADLAREKLLEKPELSLAELVEALPKSDDVETSFSVVPRHRLGFGENFHQTAFNQAIPGVIKQGELSAVIRVAESFVIARLNGRYAGDPPPFEEVRPNLVGQAQLLNQRQMRRDLLNEASQKGLIEILVDEEVLKSMGQ